MLEQKSLILALGPMAGYSDSTFRGICASFGANHTITEMVSAMGLLNSSINSKPYNQLLACDKREHSRAAQIFGHDPLVCARAAQVIESLSCFNYIDINMGCPVKKIVQNNEGSALMKTPKLAGEIVRAISRAVSLPVSVKLRIGFDESNINVLECAKILEDNGASLICIHGRTREQFYSGKANWDEIARVKQALDIPVIANGDVDSLEAAIAILKHTNCDGIMIARAAMGRPWIFKQISAYFNNEEYIEPSNEEKLNLVMQHFRANIAQKGERRAVAEAKSQITCYLHGMKNAAYLRQKLNSANDILSIEQAIKEAF